MVFIFLFQRLSAQNYITAGLNIDFGFNCNKEVIDEIGIIIPIFSGQDSAVDLI